MFQFPSCPPPTYGFSGRYPGIPPGGFPHSDIAGSSPADGSPTLFAVNHVLLRPLAPRHPPCALSSFISKHYELCVILHSVRFLRCHQDLLEASPSAVCLEQTA